MAPPWTVWFRCVPVGYCVSVRRDTSVWVIPRSFHSIHTQRGDKCDNLLQSDWKQCGKIYGRRWVSENWNICLLEKALWEYKLKPLLNASYCRCSWSWWWGTCLCPLTQRTTIEKESLGDGNWSLILAGMPRLSESPRIRWWQVQNQEWCLVLLKLTLTRVSRTWCLRSETIPTYP